MSKPFKAIVENGYQFLQTPGGERVNYLLKTTITQDTEKKGKCIFSVNVNYDYESSSLIYDAEKQQLKTRSGEILEVEVVEFIPKKNNDKPVDSVVVGCSVIFPYETNHKEPITDNQELTTAL